MGISIKTILIALIIYSSALGAAQEGVVEGTIEPPGASAQISAVREGTAVATVPSGEKTGKFRLQLAAGIYTITVSAPVSSFPIHLESIVVKPGETTVLQPVLIMPGSGKAVLAGRVIPPLRGGEVKLLSGGKERAASRIDQEGRYEFRSLPSGVYEVQTTAPGYAPDVAPVMIPENQRVRQNAVLLPIVATDGVDWATGKIHATGVGSWPADAANAASARAMAQRAAIADGQRNLLRVIERIKIDGGRSIGSLMASGTYSERIQGFVKGYKVVSERELGDGRIEVILELPLTGPSGLSRYIVE